MHLYSERLLSSTGTMLHVAVMMQHVKVVKVREIGREREGER